MGFILRKNCEKESLFVSGVLNEEKNKSSIDCNENKELRVGRNSIEISDLRLTILNLIQKVTSGQFLPSTSCSIEKYAKALFPDLNFNNKNEFLDYLQGRTIIDLGSGFPTPDNLVNSVNEYNKTAENSILAIGVDPRMGGENASLNKKGNDKYFLLDGFSARIKIREEMFYVFRMIKKLLKGDISVLPTKCNNYVAALNYNLPFVDNSIDLLLSHYMQSYWIFNSDDLLKSFKEIYRVLKSGGEVRMSPVFLSNLKYYQDEQTVFGRFIGSHYDLKLVDSRSTHNVFDQVGQTMILRTKK